MTTYARLPIAFERGEGVWLWDQDGNKYLDALSGIAVCGLGHAHPAVADALCRQAGQLLHTSNLYRIPVQEALGEELIRLSHMERVFFCNSGAEANEAAIKLARLFGHSKGIEKPAIVVAEGSFHGRTLATLSATGSRKVQAGFEPLVQGFVRVPYNDLDAMRAVATHNPNVTAVLLEPIQGEGGVNTPDDDYLAGVRALCDEQGWLLIVDEIQTGMCRTGKWFAHQHSGIRPDVMTLAKGLGNGIPIGACLARGTAASTFQPGSHGSTFGGNPLACSGALAVVKVLENTSLTARAAELGNKLMTGFRTRLEADPRVRDIRGKGLMIGIELDAPCGDLVKQALERGILINVTADNVVRLLPPLVITDEQADTIVDIVTSLISQFTGTRTAAEAP